MPIYEYRCGACGHHVEALQKMTDAPLRKCPDCGKSQLKRLVSAPQFRLKGSGWYETDFKNQNEKKRNLVEKAGAESSEAASEKSTDTAAKGTAGEAGKAVAAAKSDAETKPPKPKASPKPSTGARKAASKPRVKGARG
jgi:putative FmdB family regulatory protein